MLNSDSTVNVVTRSELGFHCVGRQTFLSFPKQTDCGVPSILLSSGCWG